MCPKFRINNSFTECNKPYRQTAILIVPYSNNITTMIKNIYKIPILYSFNRRLNTPGKNPWMTPQNGFLAALIEFDAFYIHSVSKVDKGFMVVGQGGQNGLWS